MRKQLNRKGQSTLEYVIVLTAIVAAIIFAAISFIKPSTNKIFDDMSDSMNSASDTLSSHIGHGRGAGAQTPTV